MNVVDMMADKYLFKFSNSDNTYDGSKYTKTLVSQTDTPIQMTQNVESEVASFFAKIRGSSKATITFNGGMSGTLYVYGVNGNEVASQGFSGQSTPSITFDITPFARYTIKAKVTSSSSAMATKASLSGYIVDNADLLFTKAE